MSWLTEWKAISAQIQGLLEASRFYVDSLRDSSHHADRARDFYRGGGQENYFLTSKRYVRHSRNFRDAHRETIPS